MTTATSEKLQETIEELVDELKRASLWKQTAPEWVHHYQRLSDGEFEFVDWLQFVFLPNLISGHNLSGFDSIAPQAVRAFGKEISEGRLLQLLIELDSLS